MNVRTAQEDNEAEYVVQAHHAAGSQMHAEGNLRRARHHIGLCLSVVGSIPTAISP
jgi:hypothetical protein